MARRREYGDVNVGHRAGRLLVLLAVLLAEVAAAHSPAASHLGVTPAGSGQWRIDLDLALPDAAQLLPLDADSNGALTWGELRRARAALDRQVLGSLAFAADGSDCRLTPADDLALSRYSGEQHLSLRYRAACPVGAGRHTVGFGLLFGIDPLHRVLLRVGNAGGGHLEVLTAGRPTASLAATGDAPPMLREGFAHILGGYDHLLFLLLLILPAAARGTPRAQALGLGAVVTAFTIAHSVTLGLAATGTVTLPGRLVEAAIAASIVVAGLMNVWRPTHRVGWRLAFSFGLLHGFGFAGALAEIGLAGGNLLLQLLAFNLGVEIGQLLIVLLLLPGLALLARLPRCRRVAVPGLSAAGAALGMAWAVARV